MACFGPIEPKTVPHIRKAQEIGLVALVAEQRPSPSLYPRRIVALALESWPLRLGLDAARETTLLILRFNMDGKVCTATKWTSAEPNLPQPAM